MRFSPSLVPTLRAIVCSTAVAAVATTFIHAREPGEAEPPPEPVPPAPVIEADSADAVSAVPEPSDPPAADQNDDTEPAPPPRVFPGMVLDPQAMWSAPVVTPNRLAQPSDQPVAPVVVMGTAERAAAGYPNQPVEQLGELPGVTLSQSGGISGSSSLRIRGATTAGTQTRYAGVPFNDPSATQSGPDLTLINPAAVGGIELLTGPQSGLYGSRAVGGVIDLQPLRPTADHRGSAVLQGGSFATVDGLVQATGPITQHSGYAVGMSGTSTDGISARTNHPDGNPQDFEEDGLERTGAFARGEYMPHEGLTLFASVNYLDAESEFDSFGDPDSEDPINQTTTTILHAGAMYVDDADDPTVQVAADVAWSQTQRELPEAQFGGREFEGQEWYAAARGRWRPGDGPLVAAGIDVRQESAETITVSGDSSVDESARHVGLWLRAGWSVDSWELTATGRYEHHSEEADAVTGQLQGVVQIIPDQWSAFAHIGNAYRAPSLYELFAQDDFGFGGIGNPDLDPERSWGGELGHAVTFEEVLSVSQTLFTTRYQERISFIFTEGYVNADDHVYVTGLEHRISVGDLQHYPVAMSLSHVVQRVSEPDSDVAWRLPENEARAVLSIAPHHDVRAHVGLQAVSSRSDFGGAILRAYHLLDAAVSWQVHPQVELFARGENLTNQAYELADGFAQPGIAGYAGIAAAW